jgi:hypothetical protein
MLSRLVKGLWGTKRWARGGFLVFFISSAAAQCPEISGLKSDWCISKSKATDFSAVTVQMQSGEKIPALDLPFFQLAINITYGKWASKAATTEWIIYAPPKNCPFGNRYRLGLKSPVYLFTKSTEISCDADNYYRLAGWPDSAKDACKCHLVLDNMEQKDKSIWKSNDDKLLLNQEFKIAASLINSERERTPVSFGFGFEKTGIYSVDGVRLCEYQGTRKMVDSNVGGLAKINAILSAGDKPIDIVCIGVGRGKLDISTIKFNIFNSKIEGLAEIVFESGEKVTIAPNNIN